MDIHCMRSSARVMIVGLLPRQVAQVQRRVRASGIVVESMVLERLLRTSALSAQLVVVARFCSHKHSQRVSSLTLAPVRFVASGGVSAVVRVILDHSRRNRAA